jgi:xanthine dehydrogenase YagS FAD-binding subunit
MQAFEYASPRTLEEAVALLSPEWGETEILAGGTDLLSLMKDYVVTPKRLVNIKQISELRRVEVREGVVRIGALVTLEELLRHTELARRFPALYQAAAGVTAPQIRNFGTVGGDLCQRPRCWYFRSGFGLLATGFDGEPLVPRGDNRYHAIFPEGNAYYVCPSSLAPALVALEASVEIFGPNGTRTVPVEEFYQTPKSDLDRETVLKPNEILTYVVLPDAGLRNATYEVRQRQLLDWPLVTSSVALKLSGVKVESARIVLGHVGPRPRRARAAEVVLTGAPLTEDRIAQAAQAAVEGATPLSRNTYKVRLAVTAVKRAISLLV